MSNPALDFLTGGAKVNAKGAGQVSQNQAFLNQVAQQGFTMDMNSFVRFAKMAQGKDMGSIINELRSTGQMSDEQYKTLEDKAKDFMGLLGLLKR